MKIRRIDNYTDKRFSKQVLYQHGAFLVNDVYPCEFHITGIDTAKVIYHDYSYIDKLIEEFRFYAGHITKFYTKHHKLIRRYPDVILTKRKIKDLQPSQFYVDVQKIENIMKWAKCDENFVIPIMKFNGMYVILDGHTRLYYAYMLGMKNVFTYEDESDENIIDFVEEAKKRNILDISNLESVTHEEYIDKWYSYCDKYFEGKKSNVIETCI